MGTREASAAATVRVSILGVNAWLVVLAWPLAFPAALHAVDVAMAAGVLMILGAGAIALRMRRHGLAAWILLCAYPAATVGVIALRSEAWSAEAHAGMALVLQVLSLCAYAASAADATAQTSPTLTSRPVALGTEPWDEPAAATRRLQRTLVLVCGSGAGAIALLATTLGGSAGLERDWGDTAREGGVLTAVVGACTAIAAVLTFAGALRSDQAPATSARDTTLRVALLLVGAVLGAATWFVIRR